MIIYTDYYFFTLLLYHNTFIATSITYQIVILFYLRIIIKEKKLR